MEACGTCGGVGCVSRMDGDGDDNCCTSDIKMANEICGGGKQAPCLLEDGSYVEGDDDDGVAEASTVDDGEKKKKKKKMMMTIIVFGCNSMSTGTGGGGPPFGCLLAFRLCCPVLFCRALSCLVLS